MIWAWVNDDGMIVFKWMIPLMCVSALLLWLNPQVIFWGVCFLWCFVIWNVWLQRLFQLVTLYSCFLKPWNRSCIHINDIFCNCINASDVYCTLRTSPPHPIEGPTEGPTDKVIQTKQKKKDLIRRLELGTLDYNFSFTLLQESL